MDEAIYLLKQADFLRSKVNNILVPTKWFSNEFIEKIPQCETLSFGFRGEEHDVSSCMHNFVVFDSISKLNRS